MKEEIVSEKEKVLMAICVIQLIVIAILCWVITNLAEKTVNL